VCWRVATARELVVKYWSDFAPCNNKRRVVISALSWTCSARMSEGERPIFVGAAKAVDAGATGTVGVTLGCVIVVLFWDALLVPFTCWLLETGTVVIGLDDPVPLLPDGTAVHCCKPPLPIVGSEPSGHTRVTVPAGAPAIGIDVVVLPLLPFEPD